MGRTTSGAAVQSRYQHRLKTATHLTQILDRTGKKSALWTQ